MTFPDGGRLRILSAVLMILAGHACLGWLEMRERRSHVDALRGQELSIVTAALDGAATAGSFRRAEILAGAVPLLEAQGARGIALAAVPTDVGAPEQDAPGAGELIGVSPRRGAFIATANWPAVSVIPDADVAAVVAAGAALAFAAFFLMLRAGSVSPASAMMLGIVVLPLALAQVGLIIIDAGRAETADQRRLAMLEWAITESFQVESQAGREAAAAQLLARALTQVPSLVAIDLRSPTGSALAVSHRPTGPLEAVAPTLRRALVTGRDMPLHVADLTVTFSRSLDPAGRIDMVLSATGMALVLGMIGANLAAGAARTTGPRRRRWAGSLAEATAIVLPAAAAGFSTGTAAAVAPGGTLAAAFVLVGAAVGLMLCGRLLIGRPWRGVSVAVALPAVAAAALAAVFQETAQTAVPAALGLCLGAVLGGLQARVLAGGRVAGRRAALGGLWVLAATGLAGGLIVAGLGDPIALSGPGSAPVLALMGVFALAWLSGERMGQLRLLVRTVHAAPRRASPRVGLMAISSSASVLGSAAALAGAMPASVLPALLCGIMLQPALMGRGSGPTASETTFWMAAAPTIVLAVLSSGMPTTLVQPVAGLLVGIGLGRLVLASAPGVVDLLRAGILDLVPRVGAAGATVCAGAAIVAAALGVAGVALR
ncbi:MAG: hypothetical protein Q8O26_05175 [Phreatobacter sp.]|uniref:hypothetical protein n=1 Tax=Phreatobacter sp. TaxID=1966341 RepID=UPI0027367F9D|nr:hypothetical protein [Phreatobacter sp.]MDP2801257.1 hypothetical protein [Phreatobacter sp.]